MCAISSDAIDALGMTPAVTGLMILTGGTGPVAGRAITVKIGAGPSPPGVTRHLLHRRGRSRRPRQRDRLVVERLRQGLIDAAGAGAAFCRAAAKHRGIAGSIVDGLLHPRRRGRHRQGRPVRVYARGCAGAAPRVGAVHEAGCPVPTRLGEATVVPGRRSWRPTAAAVWSSRPHASPTCSHAPRRSSPRATRWPPPSSAASRCPG